MTSGREIRKLPQLHDQLWDLFKPVRNKKDMEQFEQHLFDEALRHEFYSRLKAFSRCLHISLSSDKLFDVIRRGKGRCPEAGLEAVLRTQAIPSSSGTRETVDVREFEPKIQKAAGVIMSWRCRQRTIIELVNINDAEP